LGKDNYNIFLTGQGRGVRATNFRPLLSAVHLEFPPIKARYRLKHIQWTCGLTYSIIEVFLTHEQPSFLLRVYC